MKKIHFYKIVIEAINEQDDITAKTLSNRLKISERQVKEIVREYNKDNKNNRIKTYNSKFKLKKKLTKTEINKLDSFSDINVHLMLAVKYLIRSLKGKKVIPDKIPYKKAYVSVRSVDITLDFFGFENIRKIVYYSRRNRKYIICVLYSYFNMIEEVDYNTDLYDNTIWGVKYKIDMHKYLHSAIDQAKKLLKNIGPEHNNSASLNIITNFFLLENVLQETSRHKKKKIELLDKQVEFDYVYDVDILKSLIVLEVEFIPLKISSDEMFLDTFNSIKQYLSFCPKYGFETHFVSNIITMNFYQYLLIKEVIDLEKYTNRKIFLIMLSRSIVNQSNISGFSLPKYNRSRLVYFDKFSKRKYTLKESVDDGFIIDEENNVNIRFNSEEYLRNFSSVLNTYNYSVLSNDCKTVNIIVYTPNTHFYRVKQTLKYNYPNYTFEFINNLQYPDEDEHTYSVNPKDKYISLEVDKRGNVIVK